MHMNFYNAATFIVLFSDLFHIMITHVFLSFGPRVRTKRVTIEYANISTLLQQEWGTRM